ncbi:hypothetical protein EJB05_31818, partial [Eragrostis curvula]
MSKRCGKKTMGCGSGSAKKPRTARKGAAKVDEMQEDEETVLNFSMDLDVLECRICFMPFDAECKNGHGACGNCSLSMNRKCGSCSESIGDLRNRQLEAVLAAMTTTCKFKEYGCGESVKWTEKRSHEEACVHEPFDCPLVGCRYRGLQLYDHVQDDHAPDAAYVLSYVRGSGSVTTVTLQKATPFMVLVQPRRGLVFLLLNGGDVLAGRWLSLLCLRPRPDGNAELEYKMEVTGDEPGALSLSAAGTVPCARGLEGFQAKQFCSCRTRTGAVPAASLSKFACETDFTVRGDLVAEVLNASVPV